MSPAAISKARVRVISATTEASRQNACCLLTPAAAVPSRSPSCKGVLAAIHAGTTPKSNAEMQEASRRKQQAFGKKLLDKSVSACSERAANGDFAATVVGAGKHQPGNVRAGNQPDCDDCAVQRKNGRPRIFCECVAIVHDTNKGCGFVFWIFTEQLLVNGVDFVAGLFNGHPGT